MATRYILHCDLNNFYASVESLYNPEVRNKALVVVGNQDLRHGIVLAKNYIAKKYGIMTGDTVWEAKVKMQGEHLVTIIADFDKYYKMSHMVKDVYRSYTDKVESFGIDEAWLDITHRVKNFEEAYKLAEEIRIKIVKDFGLTISVGVSFNKVFAKLGSDIKKPNATTLITFNNFKEIVWNLPCKDLIYVGRSTSQKLSKIGVNTIGDLANVGEKTLVKLLGKNGKTLHEFANGLENSEVKSVYETEKSIGNSTTCPRDLKNNDEVKAIIYMLAESVVERMRKKDYYTKGVSLYIKDNTLSSFEKQTTFESATNLVSDIGAKCMEIFEKSFEWNTLVRSVGVRATKICKKSDEQCSFFRDENQIEKKTKLEETVEKIRYRYGYNIIKRGSISKDIDFLDMNPTESRHKIHPISFFKF